MNQSFSIHHSSFRIHHSSFQFPAYVFGGQADEASAGEKFFARHFAEGEGRRAEGVHLFVRVEVRLGENEAAQGAEENVHRVASAFVLEGIAVLAQLVGLEDRKHFVLVLVKIDACDERAREVGRLRRKLLRELERPLVRRGPARFAKAKARACDVVVRYLRVLGGQLKSRRERAQEEAAFALDALVLRRVVNRDAPRTDALHATARSSSRSRKYSSGSTMRPAIAEAATTKGEAR